MEDVLDVYQRPFNPNIPVICMDEKPFQLLGNKLEPIPMKAGSLEKQDSEYLRNGTCSIFIFTEPLRGFRHVAVCEHRTKKDWAEQMQFVLEQFYPQQEKVVLVMDNLNTHNTSSFYERFEALKARDLARRLEIHYTPKHGSWLNIAEIELSAMTTQCLDRRIGDIDTLRKELSTWQHNRNSNHKGVKWQFTTQDARIKLHHIYPKF